MWEKIKGGVVENRGTAIILSLIIVTVLFILTSFLIRKVVTNTMMVRKVKEEQESYAKAKQGILYALDRLNTWDGIDPDYDPTDWTPNEVGLGNWSDYSNYSLMVYKGYIPAPGGYTENEDYITIESRDLPKKLVTLQGIAEYKSPLVGYVKFINSDVTFSSPQTFGGLSNGSPIHVNGNLTLTGVNNIYLDTSRNDKFEIAREILPTASSDTVNILDQTGTYLVSNLNALANDGGNNGFTLVYDTENSEWVREPGNFNTASGHYFDGEHLPSSFDRSDPDNPQYVSGKSIIFWPQINEERFWDSLDGTTRLADIAISSDYCGKRGMNDDVAPYYWWDDWYPSDDSHDYGYVHIDGSTVDDVYWRREVSTDSYNYTPPGAHLIFSDTQDLDPSTSATTERLMQVNDDNTTDLPAEYETLASISYSLFTSEDVIFCEEDVRVNGVLPRDLAIVSGGNIYIDSNIYTNGHSLALLAKENVLLNTTHRWAVDHEVDEWNDPGNLAGVVDEHIARAVVNIGEIKQQVLNFGGSSTRVLVTTNQIILRGCTYSVGENNTLSFAAEVDLEGDNWQSLTIESPTFPINGPADSGPDPIIIVLEMPSASTPLSFSRIKLTATGGGAGDDPAGWIEVDAVEVPITDMDRTAIFAENGSWYVIAGNGASTDNDQQESFTLNVAISEQNFEDMSKWDGTHPLLQEATWDDITYIHDSSLKINSPPSLPPSVNLVSLKRKGGG